MPNCANFSWTIDNIKLTLWETSNGAPPDPRWHLPFTPYIGFTLGTPVFTHYTTARRKYAPPWCWQWTVKFKEMDKKKKFESI